MSFDALDSVEITVTDDGPGVPAEETERIFERFVRLDEGRARSEGGTGLGLAVARSIVQAHDGSIDLVTDSDSAGATFRVRLPKQR